ncbi:MAG: DUF3047 domain-containing protein [Betaproteobacteria bacterium]|nr:DUF3047 domain-containing protein [Betaproteobacteria bacterium]
MAALAALLLAGCASLNTDEGRRYTTIAPFSAAEPGEKLPGGWQPWVLSRFKRNTEYRLVKDADGVTVVEATSDHSASGMIKQLDVDPIATPWLSWRWRVPALIKGADNTDRNLEDSPARVIVTFDGDLDKLDFEERAIAARVRALTGKKMPYATLMYIWENTQPVDEVIPSAHTSRINMVVVESGMSRSGTWLSFTRNVADDFRRVYGEAPGRIRSIGIMTDTDNTGEKTSAFYGDIKFSARAPTKPLQ